MKNLKIAGIGELLWDLLPDSENLGGAPANFAYHVNALGAEGLAISTVGNDERGRRALELLRRNGLDTSCISVAEGYPTGYVRAELDSMGVATYTFPDDVAWDHLAINDAANRQKTHLDGVCFGTLAQRSPDSRDAIRAFLRDMPDDTVRVLDLNLRQSFYSKEVITASLQLSTILKLNDDELRTLSPMLGLPSSEPEQLAALISGFDLDLAILTRGENGSILQTSRQRSVHPGTDTKAVDTIGAGDSFTAAAVVGLLLGKPLEIINARANEVAAHVCGSNGAMPVIPERLRYT